jgi:predicted O-linked N-acetylglucosamine transferase (SPINDLY family)
LNRPAEAFEQLSQALRSNPGNAEIWNRRGLVLCALGRFDEAGRDFDRAVKLNPRYAEALCNRGKVLATLRRLDEALAAFEGAVAVEPKLVDAWYCRGNACYELERYDEAQAAFEQVLKLRPDRPDAWLGRGNVAYKLKLYGKAIAAYDRALALHPSYAEAHSNRATVLVDKASYRQAIMGFEAALRLKPDLTDAWTGIGSAYGQLGEFDKAGLAFDKALALNPHLVKAWVGRGNLLAIVKRYEDAHVAFNRALERDPQFGEAWMGKAYALEQLRRLDEAIVACDRALALDPESGFAAGTRLNLKLLACNWTSLDAEISQLLNLTRSQQPSRGGAFDPALDAHIAPGKIAQPLVMARLVDDPAVLLRCAVNWAHAYASHPAPFVHTRRARAGKIRLGYLSQDFVQQHPTGRGLIELFEKHDTSRFELHGVSLSATDRSSARRRIEASFAEFHDVSALSDDAAANLVHRLDLDVIVEMVPFSRDSRPAILACRPVPVQVNGWSAGYSSGARHLDYILGDSLLLPFSDQAFFSEKIVHLPQTCFPYDSTQPIADRIPQRSEEGLPEGSFVFCSFNSSYKNTPRFFAVWMRLLREVDGSVLWLARNNNFAVANLRRAASQAGIDPNRLVFAAKCDAIEDHLARHKLADLVLDTLPYNSQTTAMDALWAGVPVLTCVGRSYAGRFAMSQLRGIGAPELIAPDLEAYERFAIGLARDPQRLRLIRAKIQNNRLTTPLFDTERLCRELESAYASMVDIWRRGEAPRSFSVESS